MEKKFTFVELISLIVIVAIIVIIAVSFALPKTRESREKAFRVEATNIVKAAEKAVKKLNINESDSSCKINNKYCFTVKDLIKYKLYDGNPKYYSGKVEIDYGNSEYPIYAVYIKKNDEFKIIDGFRSDYTEFGILSIYNWNEDYEKCNCE